MSLPSVEWRYVGTRSVSSATIDVLIDNIYTLATSTQYFDGSTRTQGIGSAGTWNRYQNAGITEAIYVTPTAGNQKIIIAGSSGTPSPSPTMASPDTYLTNSLMVNITKNPGNFTSWNASNPFASGNAFGYWRFFGSHVIGNAGLSPFTGNIYLYESKESIGVFLIYSTGTSSTSYSNGMLAGALWDPQSADTTDVESDGRLYGIITSGHYAGTASHWSNNSIWAIDQFNNLGNGPGFLVSNAGTAGYPHIGAFNPGTGTIKSIGLMFYPMSANSSSSLITPSGKFARIPLIYRYSSTNQIVGRLREVSLCQRGLIGQRHSSSSNIIGYVVSCSDYASTTGDAILLEY